MYVYTCWLAQSEFCACFIPQGKVAAAGIFCVNEACKPECKWERFYFCKRTHKCLSISLGKTFPIYFPLLHGCWETCQCHSPWLWPDVRSEGTALEYMTLIEKNIYIYLLSWKFFFMFLSCFYFAYINCVAGRIQLRGRRFPTPAVTPTITTSSPNRKPLNYKLNRWQKNKIKIFPPIWTSPPQLTSL